MKGAAQAVATVGCALFAATGNLPAFAVAFVVMMAAAGWLR